MFSEEEDYLKEFDYEITKKIKRGRPKGKMKLAKKAAYRDMKKDKFIRKDE